MMNVTLYACAPDADHRHFGRAKYSKQCKLKTTSSSLAALAKAKLATMDAVLPNYVAESGVVERYKLFALLLAKSAPNMFSMEQCVWSFSKQKEGTARVVFWRQFNIQNAFTMKSSFCNAALAGSSLKDLHFNPEYYLQMGAKFCGALYDAASKTNEAKQRLLSAVKHLKAISMETQTVDGDNRRRCTRTSTRCN